MLPASGRHSEPAQRSYQADRAEEESPKGEESEQWSHWLQVRLSSATSVSLLSVSLPAETHLPHLDSERTRVHLSASSLRVLPGGRSRLRTVF